ncbi:MAG TPA: hypothetical protein V6C91_01345 [Coleofasciculaceae cyanobacterium]
MTLLALERQGFFHHGERNRFTLDGLHHLTLCSCCLSLSAIASQAAITPKEH